MQYSSHATNQDIVTMARLLAGADSDALPIEELTLYANTVSAKVWHWIFESYGGMKYDDANQAGSPTATDDLINGQSDYTLPTNLLTIGGIEVKDEAGNWKRLVPLTEEKIREHNALGEFENTAGNPTYYISVGDTLTLYPAPNYDLSDGLKYFFDRSDVEFATVDNTKEPGFASVYHEVIPFGVAELYCMAEEKSRVDRLSVKMLEFERNIKDFYLNRYKAIGRANMKSNIPRRGGLMGMYG